MTTNFAARAHFNNYDPSSFGWPHRVPDLVPFTFKGVNFGTCARDVHGLFVALLTELEPHIPGGIAFGPKDDWAYSATDDLPDGSWSFHRYGIAFDLNWRENPMGNYANNPNAGDKGAIPYKWAADIARKYGCEYGGSWSGGPNRLGFKDYMHFECHLSPADARAVKPPAPPADLLEWIMSLPGAPKGLTYSKLVDDIAAASAVKVWTVDAVPAPIDPNTGKVDPKNPTWAPGSYFRAVLNRLAALAPKAGSK